MLIRCPGRPSHDRCNWPVDGSQAFTLRWLAVNRVLPSGVNRMASTQSVWPVNVSRDGPPVGFHSRTVSSQPPLANCPPPGAIATWDTLLVCPENSIGFGAWATRLADRTIRNKAVLVFIGLPGSNRHIKVG